MPLTACAPQAQDDLVFTESGEQAGSQSEQGSADSETVRSDVEVPDTDVQRKTLLILPFVNNSRNPNIDFLIKGMPELIGQVFENDRFILPVTIDPNSHNSLIRSHGLAGGEIIDMEIARLYHLEQKADLILCGTINESDRDLVIVPHLFTFGGDEGTEEQLPQLMVRPGNFLRFVNPLTESIKNYLVERQ